ncbi:hypothetical protein D3C87_1965970 [compost metagenome]
MGAQFGEVAEHHGGAAVRGGRERGKAGRDLQLGLDRNGLQVMGGRRGLVGWRIGHGGFLAGCWPDTARCPGGIARAEAWHGQE